MDQNQRRLKALVIFLGVLLVICFFIVAGTIAYRLSGMAAEEEAPQAAMVPEKPHDMIALPSQKMPAALSMSLPAGARVTSITQSNGRYLMLMDTTAGQQAWLVDGANGSVLQVIHLVPAQ